MDRLVVEMRAERGRGAAVRQRGSQLMAQYAANLETANSLLSVQRELEEEIRRRQVERTVERVIEIFAAQGMFAFRWDTTSGPPLISLPRSTNRAALRIQ
jgi:hypothetical protein